MKAVVFDLFETLVTEWGHEKYTKRQIANDLGIPNEDFSAYEESCHEALYLGEKTYEQMLVEISQKYNSTANINNIMKHRIETKSGCFQDIREDIIDILFLIKEKGYKLGLVSNCSSDEMTIFKQSRIFPFFDSVILSFEVCLAKPSLDIFKKCCDDLKIPAKECLYFGDGSSNELPGAKLAGMKPYQVIWFTQEFKSDYINKEGFPVLDSPRDVIALL